MLKFKRILTERQFSDDLDELIKNLDIISVLGSGLGKISADVKLNNYRDINDLEIGKVDKIIEILTALTTTIPKTEKILNTEGNNEQENSKRDNGDNSEEEIDGSRDFEFTGPRKKLPTNF
jgi:hypothetical protein